MSLRKAFFGLLAIGCTSTALLSFSGGAAQAASFHLTYEFKGGTTFSALLDGELEDNGNVVSINALESASVSDSDGNTLSLIPGDLAFKSKLTLDGGFAALSSGDIGQNEPDSVKFSVFNNLTYQGKEFSFADLVYQNSQGNHVRLSQAFSYGAYTFEKADIPESSSVAVLLTALAGMGFAIAKRQHNQQEA